MVIANNGKLKKELAHKYLTTEQKDEVILDYKETKSIVDKIISDDLIIVDKNDFFRHDTLKLGFLIFSSLINQKKN